MTNNQMSRGFVSHESQSFAYRFSHRVIAIRIWRGHEGRGSGALISPTIWAAHELQHAGRAPLGCPALGFRVLPAREREINHSQTSVHQFSMLLRLRERVPRRSDQLGEPQSPTLQSCTRSGMHHATPRCHAQKPSVSPSSDGCLVSGRGSRTAVPVISAAFATVTCGFASTSH